MSDDASLTDFSGDDGEEVDGDDTGDDTTEPDDEQAKSASPDDVEEPVFTYTWSAEGAECAACGETVERRWHAGEGDAPDLDPDALVCPDCKEW